MRLTRAPLRQNRWITLADRVSSKEAGPADHVALEVWGRGKHRYRLELSGEELEQLLELQRELRAELDAASPLARHTPMKDRVARLANAWGCRLRLRYCPAGVELLRPASVPDRPDEAVTPILPLKVMRQWLDWALQLASQGKDFLGRPLKRKEVGHGPTE